MEGEIHVCTLNEEGSIRETLESLDGQGYPIKVLDSHSDDNTQDIARECADVVEVPSGKLTARDYGFNHTDADVVMTADAGDIYPSQWAEEMMSPFESSENVVGVQGPCFSKEQFWTVQEILANPLRRALYIQGNNSAVKVDAYKQIGGFDTDIKQTNRRKIWKEEEFGFRRKLERVGQVVYNGRAWCLKSQRHMGISEEDNDEYLKERKNGDRF